MKHGGFYPSLNTYFGTDQSEKAASVEKQEERFALASGTTGDTTASRLQTETAPAEK